MRHGEFTGARAVALAVLAALAPLAGCASQERAADGPAPESDLAVHFREGELGVRTPAGWIYAFGFADGRKDLCVCIWNDGTWTLAQEDVPGLFDQELAAGDLVAAGEGVALAADFPAHALEGAGELYTSGTIDAVYRGQPLGARE